MNSTIASQVAQLPSANLSYKRRLRGLDCLLGSKLIAKDELIHVYGGGGHTTLVMGEMFFRAGGLANINPIMEPGLSVFNQALKY